HARVNYCSMGRRVDPIVWGHRAAVAGGPVKNGKCSRRGALGTRGDQSADIALRRTYWTDCSSGQALRRIQLADAEYSTRQVEGIRRVKEWRVLRSQGLERILKRTGNPSTRVQ